MANKKVGIWSAYQWTCEECGQDNFERAITCELTPDERQELAEENGLDPDYMQGEMVSYPEEVVCKHCGTEFETENPETE